MALHRKYLPGTLIYGCWYHHDVIVASKAVCRFKHCWRLLYEMQSTMMDECTIAHSIEFPLYGNGRCQYELGGQQLLGKHHDFGVSQSLDHGVKCEWVKERVKPSCPNLCGFEFGSPWCHQPSGNFKYGSSYCKRRWRHHHWRRAVKWEWASERLNHLLWLWNLVGGQWWWQRLPPSGNSKYSCMLQIPCWCEQHPYHRMMQSRKASEWANERVAFKHLPTDSGIFWCIDCWIWIVKGVFCKSKIVDLSFEQSVVSGVIKFCYGK